MWSSHTRWSIHLHQLTIARTGGYLFMPNTVPLDVDGHALWNDGVSEREESKHNVRSKNFVRHQSSLSDIGCLCQLCTPFSQSLFDYRSGKPCGGRRWQPSIECWLGCSEFEFSCVLESLEVFFVRVLPHCVSPKKSTQSTELRKSNVPSLRSATIIHR